MGPHVEVVECPMGDNGLIDLAQILELLFKRGIKQLLVEGGSTVIWEFLRKGVFDDLFIYIGPCIIGGKETPTVADGDGVNSEKDILPLKIQKCTRLGEGILIHYTPL